MAVAGGEQADVFGPPARLEQLVDAPVRDLDRVVDLARHEPHVEPVAAVGIHP